MPFDKTIQMYIFNGNPNGMIMSEISNWTGRVYKIARTELAQFAKRSDSGNTGFYFLFGKNDDNTDTVYIGEAENIIIRLKQHLNEKEYWTDCITVISKDNFLNKAHIKYLEHQFYTYAKNSGRAEVINSTVPTCSSLSEYDEAMLEEFISNTKLLVNTLGYKVFDSIEQPVRDTEKPQIKFYTSNNRGADATGIIVSDGFAVLKGSKIANSTVTSVSQCTIKHRERLKEKNIINEQYIFTVDYVFSSPSTASDVVLGASTNGKTTWKTKSGKTIKELELEEIKALD